jgi:hypothetical protein
MFSTVKRKAFAKATYKISLHLHSQYFRFLLLIARTTFSRYIKSYKHSCTQKTTASFRILSKSLLNYIAAE